MDAHKRKKETFYGGISCHFTEKVKGVMEIPSHINIIQLSHFIKAELLKW